MTGSPPVGVRLLRAATDHADVPIYRGVSYCDAVRRAGEGERLRVLPGSIQVCRNATVLPLLTRRVNASLFCAGGITWGRHRADHLVCGWPLSHFHRVADVLLYGESNG